MGNAKRIKEWCETEVAPTAWPLIAMRALPEILAVQKNVSLMNIGDHMEFSPEVINIIVKCITRSYEVTIPREIIEGSDLQSKKNGSTENRKEKRSILNWLSNIFKSP